MFIQPYTQQPLILYQLETVPIPILDKNDKAQSYTQLQIGKPYITLNSETYISLRLQEPKTCKRIGYEFYCEELFVVKHKTSYMNGCFSFCLTSFILDIFSKTEQYFLLLDKLSPDSVMASSRSEENVVLNNFQHKRCISVGIPY